MPIMAYKLFRVRKDGSIGPLFINRTQRIERNMWLMAEAHPTKGYAYRPGWHCCERPVAPHLSMKGRRWYKVKIDGWVPHNRSAAQGGRWFIADSMMVLRPTGKAIAQ